MSGRALARHGGLPVILWRIDDARELASRLAAIGLAVEPASGAGGSPGIPPGTWVVRLSGAVLVVRAAHGRGPRLVLFDDPAGRSPRAFGGGGAPDEDTRLAAPLAGAVASGDGTPPRPGGEVVAIGWATVDLERAARDLAPPRDTAPAGDLAARDDGPDTDGDALGPLPSDVALGARAALLRRRGPPRIVLLEPEREGRLAASLARFGEGPSVLYVRLAGRRRPPAAGPPVAGQAALRRSADGPFGPERLLDGGAGWGPHVIAIGGGRAGRPTGGRERVPSRP